MLITKEKTFPRGGNIHKVAEPTDVKEKKDSIVYGAVQLQPKKKPRNKQSKKSGNDIEEEAIKAVTADLLSYSTIQDGMNIMGVVESVSALHLGISLPGRMNARVEVLEISDSYTKITQEFVSNPEKAEFYKPLSQLYRVGQIVYARVQEVQHNDQGRWQIKLSLKPSAVHSDLWHGGIKKGFIFNGAIEEIQEHGYIIESGIKGLRAFLPSEKSNGKHVVGELVFMKVKTINIDKAASTCTCEEITPDKIKIKKQLDPNLDYMLPASIVKFQVTKHLKDGLQGKIMNEAFTAYINEHQLADPLAMPEDYELGANLSARILYVMPLTKIIYLTLNLRNTVDAEEDVPALKRGDIIEDARVIRLGTGGVILVINNKFKGVISYKSIRANFKGNYDQDELLVKYAKKTAHKVRVLSYDSMDSMYICTDDASIVNEAVFSLDDIQPGTFVTGLIKDAIPVIGGYTLQMGKVKGTIEKLFLAPTSKILEENTKLRCRVISVDRERRQIYLTNRPEYMAKTCKVLTSLEDAKVNAIFTGTVVKSSDTLVLVKFFNFLNGVLYQQQLNGFMAPKLSDFHEGQTMQFRIVSKNEDKILIGLVEQMFQMGKLCSVTIVNSLESGLEVNVHAEAKNDNETATTTKGLIPLRWLSDYVDLLEAHKLIYPIDTTIEAASMVKNMFSVRDVAYFKQHNTPHWRSVKIGDILRAYVKNVMDDVVEVMVPIYDYSKLVKVHVNMLVVDARNSNVSLVPEQVIYVKVKAMEMRTRTLTVSSKLTDVWDGQMESTSEYLASYLNEVKSIKSALKKQGHPIAKYSVGDKVKVKFKCVNEETKDWLFELPEPKILAVLKPSIYNNAKLPAVGAKQEAVILWIDYSNLLMYISNRSTDIAHTSNKTKYTFKLGYSGLNARVLLKHANVVVCSLKKADNPLFYCPIRLHYNDFENSASAGMEEGAFCKLRVMHDTLPIAVLDETHNLWKTINLKRKAQEQLEALIPKKSKDSKASETILKKDANTNDKVPAKGLTLVKEKIKLKKEEQSAIEIASKLDSKNRKSEVDTASDSVLFFEDKNKGHAFPAEEEPVPKKTKSNTPSLPGINDFWNTNLMEVSQSNDVESSDEDDDEDAEQTMQKKKKLTAAEKFKQQREEEARLREIEEKYADPNQIPETVDQFDRLVLSEPNNSKHWITYMVFHLQSAEIDKARAVARRAIKAISFREGDEQLNIWIALLNLELRYGNKDSYDETLKEALTYNDQLKVYLRVLEILKDANKTQELIDTIGVITKKFKTQQDVWRAAANSYFSLNMIDKAQSLLNKALSNLPERDHVNTIVMFAYLNHKYDQNEMAQTLLDQIVTAYPKRVDVWAQYVDMLVKVDLIDSARIILDRAVAQTIPLKKMRTIFKKYLDFEERYGTDADVEKVKQMAMDYVKKHTKA